MVNNTPSNEIPLPKELEKHVEKVRQNVLVQEAGLKNLQKASEAEKISIQDLLKRKGELEIEVSSLEESIATLSDKVVVLRKEDEELSTAIEGGRLLLQESEETKTQNYKDCEEREADVKLQEEGIAKKQSILKHETELLENRVKSADAFRKEVEEVFSRF